MDPIAAAFEPVLGLPSWLVTRGHGSFITMEFGEREPTVEDPTVRTLRAVRGESRKVSISNAVVHGAWHLWTYCCRWTIFMAEDELANWESDEVVIDRALRTLDGQALTGALVDALDGSSTFTFDLGCTLATAPVSTGSDESAEQWMLYQPSGEVLTIRSDGFFKSEVGGRIDDSQWRPLPTGT